MFSPQKHTGGVGFPSDTTRFPLPCGHTTVVALLPSNHQSSIVSPLAFTPFHETESHFPLERNRYKAHLQTTRKQREGLWPPDACVYVIVLCLMNVPVEILANAGLLRLRLNAMHGGIFLIMKSLMCGFQCRAFFTIKWQHQVPLLCTKIGCYTPWHDLIQHVMGLEINQGSFLILYRRN